MKKVCFPWIENLQIPKFKHNYGNAIFPLNLNSISSCNSPFFGGGGRRALGALWSHLGLLHVGEWWGVSSQWSLLLPSTRRSTIPPNAPCSLPVLPVSLPVSLAKHWGALCGLKWWRDASSKITEGPRGVLGVLGGGFRFSSRIFLTMSEPCDLWRCPFLSCSQQSSSEVILLLSISI